MKRVKLMLLSLTLLAVVGGALAFKARFIHQICTTDLYNEQLGTTTCPDLTVYRYEPAAATVYTTTPQEGACTYRDGSNILPLTCKTYTYSDID